MDNHKEFIAPFCIGMGSSFAVSAFGWYLNKDNLLTACLIFMIVACFFMLMYLLAIIAINKQHKRSVLFAEQVGGSDFEFYNLADTASDSIFIVGPNLNYFAKERWVKEMIFLLMDKRNIRVRLLLTNPSSPACSTMNDNAFTSTFEKELQESIEIFIKWKQEADQKSLNFGVKVADVVTLSMFCVDAENKCGKLLIIPIPWKLIGSKRPCFMLEKKNQTTAFLNYYESYNELYNKMAQEI